MSQVISLGNVLIVFNGIILSCNCASKSYGEFILNITDFEICKGPKQHDCTNITARLENGTIMFMDVQIKDDVTLSRGKVEAMVNSEPLLRLQMKKPCDHLFMKPLFQQIFNITQKCEFKKGNYNLKINIEEIAQKYYGGMFLYGNLRFKSLFYNDKCNFSCVNIEVTFSPKNH